MVESLIWFIATPIILTLTVLSGRRINKAWLVALGLAPLGIVHIGNPAFRVWSFHSFMHGGIAYQILNGNLPPNAPLIGEAALHYPWGVHMVAAGLSRVLRITPFASIAAISAVSLVLVMVLVYRIARLITPDERADMLAVFTSVYGVTALIPAFVRQVSPGLPLEFRGMPMLMKYINTNVLPLGMVCFLVFVYAATQIFRGVHRMRHALVMAASVAGCGFFYPAFLPGLVAGTGLVLVICLVYPGSSVFRWNLRMAIALIVPLMAGLVAVYSYLVSIGTGLALQVEFLNPRFVRDNLARFLIVAVPILIVIAANARHIVRISDRRSLCFIAALAAANLGCYAVLHLPFNNEYKFMLLATVMLGILGGIALGTMADRLGRGWVLILLFLFLFPSFRLTMLRAGHLKDVKAVYAEDGTAVASVDAHKQELYEWIRTSTPKDAIFVDEALDIPVLGQRQLFIPVVRPGVQTPRGYGQLDRVVKLLAGYNSTLVEDRGQVAKHLFDRSGGFNPSDLELLSNLSGPVFAVLRYPALYEKFDRVFEEAFTTSQDGMRVYMLKDRSHSPLP